MALNNYEILYHTNHDKQSERTIPIRAHTLKKALKFAEKHIRMVERPRSIHFERYKVFDSKRKEVSSGFCIKNV